MEITSRDYRRLTVWRRLLILNLLLAPVWAFGQTNAEGYFHKGAQYYIFGDKPAATKAITNGLQLYPTDEKLNAVARLLLKKDPEDQNKSKSGQQGQKQNQDQKDQQNQSQGQKGNQDNQKQEQQKQAQSQAQQDKDQKKNPEQAKAAAGDKRDKQQNQNADAAAAVPAEMSLQQAEQMLAAARDDEKALIFSPQNQPAKTIDGKIKDW